MEIFAVGAENTEFQTQIQPKISKTCKVNNYKDSSYMGIHFNFIDKKKDGV